MLYEKNRKENELSKKLFEAPTAEYRGTPFWAWNCELDEKELLRQIDVFKEMGLGGFHMHVRTGMSTEYLSDQFMHLIRACTDHAKQNEMLSWLYDEDRWPSGAAGGIVTKNHSMRQRYIRFSPNPERALGEDDFILARFDIVLNDKKELSSYKKLDEGENAQGTLWTVYREVSKNNSWYNNQAYLDTLNPKAVEKFVEVTHERYAEIVGDEFGKTVPAIFTDEPQFSHKQVLPFADSLVDVTLPWTDDIEDTYKAAYGVSLVDHLPELLWDLPNGEPSLTRYHYHDHIANRFTEAFADTCGKWCTEHGIELTGHMMEEPSLRSQTAALGEAMRSYRSFGLPGIDMLCGFFEFTTAKQCQSAVHQYGRRGMMSELYGVTGWDFDFRGHKLHGDWQAALGVTIRVPHLSWVSMKGNAKRDYPASISYQSSWYKEYSYVEDHFARVNTALTRGKPMVKVGVIHPVESYWLHWGPEEQTALVRSNMDDNFNNVTQWLLRGSIDFDFISESLLPSLCEKASAPLNVGEMSYDVVIVPECETLRTSTLERLEAFAAAGGKLIFMGSAPKYENAVPSARGAELFSKATNISFSRGALLSALEDYRTLDIRNSNGTYSNNLIHQLRRDNNGVWLFISHCDEPYNKDMAKCGNFKISIDGEFVPEYWNTLNGEVTPLAYEIKNGKTYISLTLYEYDSALVFFKGRTSEESKLAGTPAAKYSTLPIYTLPNEVEYSLSEPNVLLLDMARVSADGGEFRPIEEIRRLDTPIRNSVGLPENHGYVAQPWVIENKPAEHTVTLEFSVKSEIEVNAPMLALEDADVAEITLNGEAVAYNDCGYYTDLCIRKVQLPKLNIGENIITVKLPLGERTNIECCYLLGDFGVRIDGKQPVITKLPEKLNFEDITKQGLPFYGGCVSYHIPFTVDEASDLKLRIHHYRAGVMTAELDGEKIATVAYPPYDADLGELSAGEHKLTINAYISRHNCFGHIHCADEKYRWLGPNCWSTGSHEWTYEYRVFKEGILSTPVLFKKN